MASEKIKLSVGIFVFLGIIFFVVFIVWLGASNFYKKGNYYLTFFDESVQGLEIGSSVKYRGVNVGRVEKIGISAGSRFIEILMKIHGKKPVDGDIVVQLKSVGITGIIYMELDIYDNKSYARPLKPGFDTQYKVIPSIPSDVSEIMDSLQDIVFEFKSMNFKVMSEKMAEVFDNLNKQLNAMKTAEISEKIIYLLNDFNKGIENINIGELTEGGKKLIKEMEINLNKLGTLITHIDYVLMEENNMDEIIAELREGIIGVNSIIQSMNDIINGNKYTMDRFPDKIDSTLDGMEKSINNFNSILEIIKDQPSIIFSPPPAKREYD